MDPETHGGGESDPGSRADGNPPPGRTYGVEHVTINPALPENAMNAIIEGEQRAARNGLVVGAIVVLLGVVLLILGVAGSVDITVTHGGSSGHLVTGAVGIVIALIGLAIIYATRYRVHTSPPAGGRTQ